MQKYGLLEGSHLLLSSSQLDGYKPVKYATLPEFDQTTHYVVEGTAVDEGEFILISMETKELDLNDETIEEPRPVEEYTPYVPKPTDEERLNSLENVILTLMME